MGTWLNILLFFVSIVAMWGVLIWAWAREPSDGYPARARRGAARAGQPGAQPLQPPA